MNDEFDSDKFLEDFRNRKKYKKLNEEVMNGIDDEDLVMAVMDCIDYKMPTNYKRIYKTIMGLPKGFQVIYTTWCVEAEVNNGGFNQYFFNSSGQFAIEAIDGFEEIGAPFNAQLMKKAIEVAVQEMPEMKKYYKSRSIELFSESYKHTKLNNLDEGFYERKEDIQELQIKYIRSHPQLFIDNRSFFSTLLARWGVTPPQQ